MSDSFGALTLPVPVAPPPITDPLLGIVGDFAAYALNQDMRTAWAALRPRTDPDDTLPVRVIFTHPPEKVSLRESDLPALFVWRQSGQFSRKGEDLLEDASEIQLLWVLPTEHPEHGSSEVWLQTGNAVGKILARWFWECAIPGWVAPNDPDPLAVDIPADPDAIKFAFATSTSPVTLSGAQLDGIIGTSTMSPRRGPTATLAPAVGAYSLAPWVWTVVDWYGATTTRTAAPTSANGGETIGVDEDVAQVVSVFIPGQVSTAGSIQLGTAQVDGRGSDLMGFGGLASQPQVTGWRLQDVDVDVMTDDETTRNTLRYQGIAVTLSALETLIPDLSAVAYPHAFAPGGIDIDLYREGLNVSRAELRSP
jgi:hypothetical protein